MEQSWGSMDPNSAHQLWSRWEFRVHGKPIPTKELRFNVARWLRKGFGSAGRCRISNELTNGSAVTLIEVEIEGVAAHDPAYVRSVKRGFARFVEQGWGRMAYCSVEVEVLAGDVQNGKPPAQLVVMPTIPKETPDG